MLLSLLFEGRQRRSVDSGKRVRLRIPCLIRECWCHGSSASWAPRPPFTEWCAS